MLTVYTIISMKGTNKRNAEPEILLPYKYLPLSQVFCNRFPSLFYLHQVALHNVDVVV